MSSQLILNTLFVKCWTVGLPDISGRFVPVLVLLQCSSDTSPCSASHCCQAWCWQLEWPLLLLWYSDSLFRHQQLSGPVLGQIIRTIRLFEYLGPNIGIWYSYSFIFWASNTIRTNIRIKTKLLKLILFIYYSNYSNS